MPDTSGDVLALLRTLKVISQTAYIEHVVGFIPGGGVGAMFTFGEGFGYLQGCLDALGYRTIRVRPMQWQKELQLGRPETVKIPKDATEQGKAATKAANARAKAEWKNKLKAEAQRRFPSLSVTLRTADALLILEYGLTRQPSSLVLT